MLLQFGDGDSRNCCWNRDKRNQELLNSLLSVGPPCYHGLQDEPEMARGSLRMLGYWNCWFSHFVAGVGDTFGVGSGDEESS